MYYYYTSRGETLDYLFRGRCSGSAVLLRPYLNAFLKINGSCLGFGEYAYTIPTTNSHLLHRRLPDYQAICLPNPPELPNALFVKPNLNYLNYCMNYQARKNIAALCLDGINPYYAAAAQQVSHVMQRKTQAEAKATVGESANFERGLDVISLAGSTLEKTLSQAPEQFEQFHHQLNVLNRAGQALADATDLHEALAAEEKFSQVYSDAVKKLNTLTLSVARRMVPFHMTSAQSMLRGFTHIRGFSVNSSMDIEILEQGAKKLKRLAGKGGFVVDGIVGLLEIGVAAYKGEDVKRAATAVVGDIGANTLAGSLAEKGIKDLPSYVAKTAPRVANNLYEAVPRIVQAVSKAATRFVANEAAAIEMGEGTGYVLLALAEGLEVAGAIAAAAATAPVWVIVIVGVGTAYVAGHAIKAIAEKRYDQFHHNNELRR